MGPLSRSCGGLEGPFGPCWEPLSSVLCPLSSVLCPLSSVSALHYHLVQYIVLLYSDPRSPTLYTTYCSHSQSVWNIMEEVGVDTLAENRSFRNQNLTHKVNDTISCLSGKVLAFCL